jgi:hypothetical protein
MRRRKLVSKNQFKETSMTSKKKNGATARGAWLAVVAVAALQGETFFVFDKLQTMQMDEMVGVAHAQHGLFAAGNTEGILFLYPNGRKDAFFAFYSNLNPAPFERDKSAKNGPKCAVQFGTKEADHAAALVQGPDRVTAYVVGRTAGQFPGQESKGNWDAFVTKFDESCNQLWTRQFGTEAADAATSVAVDGTGVYLTGWFGGPPLMGFVRKYDHNGGYLWTQPIVVPNSEPGSALPNGAATDPTGLYVAGSTNGNLAGLGSSKGGYDAFVRKYDSGGGVLWTRQFGSRDDDFGNGIATDMEAPTAPGSYYSGVYIVGTTKGLLSSTSVKQGGTDGFIRKYDWNGIEKWTDQISTPGDDHALAVAASAEAINPTYPTDAANVYVVGTTRCFPMGGEIPLISLSNPDSLPGLSCWDYHEPDRRRAFVRQYRRESGNYVWTMSKPSYETESTWRETVPYAAFAYPGGVGVWVAGSFSEGGFSDAFIALAECYGGGIYCSGTK